MVIDQSTWLRLHAQMQTLIGVYIRIIHMWRQRFGMQQEMRWQKQRQTSLHAEHGSHLLMQLQQSNVSQE
jgi:hypothetical protein